MLPVNNNMTLKIFDFRDASLISYNKVSGLRIYFLIVRKYTLFCYKSLNLL